MEKTVTKRSLLMRLFPPDLCVEIERITMLADFNNNEKGQFIRDLLTSYGVRWSGLGPGTNRMGLLIDGYAVKFALDKDGMIDNRREFLYTKDLQPYVIKVYECFANGLIAVCEYVEIFTLDDLNVNKQNMRKILEEITSAGFLIGDVGITSKNYNNWGTRQSTGELVILDFAYIYNVKYKLFTCNCDGETMVVYDNDYVTMHCPRCGRKYTFGELRKKISRKNQEDEIGDIRRLGYVLTEPCQVLPIIPDFEPNLKKPKKKKKLSETEKAIREYQKQQKKRKKYAW